MSRRGRRADGRRGGRVVAAGATAAACLAVTGCGVVSFGPAQSSTAGSTSTRAGYQSSAGTPAGPTTTTTPPPPDALPSDLTTLVVPAYCQLPAMTMTSGTARPSVGPGRGELVLSGPSAPLFTDVNGDGAKEAVVEYRCDTGGTPWPSMILVVAHGGIILGRVNLGEIARTEHATITAWRPEGEGVAVDWVAYDGPGYDKRPRQNELILRGAAVSFATTDRGRTLAGTSIVDLPGGAAFVAPNGSIGCRIDGASATCEVLAAAWKPSGEPPSSCLGKNYANTLVLRDGQATYGCADESVFRAAAADQDTRWRRDGTDPVIRSGRFGEMAGVAYGRTMTTGKVSCAVALAGVTCTDVQTGHGFTIAQDAERRF